MAITSMVGATKTSSENTLWQPEISFAGQEIIGQRSSQEDYSLFRVLKGGAELLVVLADGMGGHTSGEVASKNVVTAFDSTFVEYPSDSVPTKLGASLQQANHVLSRLVQENNSLEGMGCTLVGAHVSAEGLHWISVGDSLLYLYRDGGLIHLNADHSMAPVIEESYRAGKITKEEALAHPNKNALRSAIMGVDIPLIDSPKYPTPLFRGDVLIVASDGLLTLSESKICEILKKHSGETAGKISKALVAAVEGVNKPHQDNTTVQILIVPSSFLGGGRTTKKVALLIAVCILFLVAVSAIFFANPFGLHDKFGIDFSAPKEANSLPQPVPVPLVTQPPNPVSLQTPQEAEVKNNPATDTKKSIPTKPENGKAKPSSDAEVRGRKGDVALKAQGGSAAGSGGGSIAAAGGLESPVIESAGAGGASAQEPKPQSEKKPQSVPPKAEPQGE